MWFWLITDVGDKLLWNVAVKAAFPSTGYLGYTSGLSLLCMVFFLIVVSRTCRHPTSTAWGLLLKRPFLLCHPGDHQEVPDPVSSASG